MKRKVSKDQTPDAETIYEVRSMRLANKLKPGLMMAEVRDKKLYRDKHNSFEDFLRDEMKMLPPDIAYALTGTSGDRLRDIEIPASEMMRGGR